MLYGGAAGGGKSEAALMAAAQYVHVPGYSALLLRENFPDLNQADALIPRSRSWWAGTAARWNERDRRWTFPCPGGGISTITFGYLDSDNAVYQYQGSAFQLIGIDELTQHTERRYRYLFSRLRKPATGPLAHVPLRMRGGTNPGGRGHQWVFDRFVSPSTRAPGAVFVPAKLQDNPSLDATEYVRSLTHVDPLTRAQLLAGDWSAVEGGRFKKEWFAHRYSTRGDYIVLKRPGEAQEYAVRWQEGVRFGTCDPAASAKNTADFTAVGAWLLTPRNELVLLDALRFRAEIPDIVPQLQSFAARWKLGWMGIEGVASNVAVYQTASRTNMACRLLTPGGTDKLTRATTALVMAEAGRIWLPVHGQRPGMPLDDIESELYRFTGDDKRDDHDDMVDVFSYAAQAVTTGAADQRGIAPRIHSFPGY